MTQFIKVQSNIVLESSINEENIAILVRKFYPEVLKDTLLAPFFIEKLGEDIENKAWKEHLVLLTEFWKFVVLGYENYEGNPLQPHFDIRGLSREAFGRWLEVFFTTLDSMYNEQASEYFKEKSQGIADSFMRKLEL
jgi:hemoglobin